MRDNAKVNAGYMKAEESPRDCFICGCRMKFPVISRGCGDQRTDVYWCSKCGALEVLDYERGRLTDRKTKAIGGGAMSTINDDPTLLKVSKQLREIRERGSIGSQEDAFAINFAEGFIYGCAQQQESTERKEDGCLG